MTIEEYLALLPSPYHYVQALVAAIVAKGGRPKRGAMPNHVEAQRLLLLDDRPVDTSRLEYQEERWGERRGGLVTYSRQDDERAALSFLFSKIPSDVEVDTMLSPLGENGKGYLGWSEKALDA